MISGWAFLVARGRTRDYRTVLVPDFLADDGLHAHLADSLPVGDPDEVTRTTTITCPSTGTLTVTSRTAELNPTDTGDGRADALDEHGRPLEYLYGIVHSPDAPAPAGAGDLDIARDRALISYRRFLADEETFTFDRSTAFPLTAAIPTPPAPPMLDELRPPGHRPVVVPCLPTPARQSPGRRPGRRVLPVLAVGGLVLAEVVLLIAVLNRSPIAGLELTPARADAERTCSGPFELRLRGSITVTEPAEVTIRWTQDDQPSGVDTLPLARAGDHDIDRTITVPAPGTGVQEHTVELVAELTGSTPTTTTTTYRYSCHGR